MLFKSNKKSNKEERESKKKEREREVKDEIKTKGKGDKTKNWEDTAKGKVEEVSEREEITSKVLPGGELLFIHIQYYTRGEQNIG